MTDNPTAQLTEVDSDQDVISRVMTGDRDAFAMLIGVAGLITWFIFGLGGQ